MNDYDYKEDASQYDQEVKEYNSFVHDVIFGMSYEYVNTGEKLLDLGIGSGLASINFSKVGLKIYGLDSSQDMLKICKSKLFSEELRLHNIVSTRLPYNDNFFDHIICSGVLHFYNNLEFIFKEVTRVIRKNGIFAFTFSPDETSEHCIEEMTIWGVPIYKHSPIYIKNLLNLNGLQILKEQRLLIKGSDKLNYNMLFSVLIVRYY